MSANPVRPGVVLVVIVAAFAILLWPGRAGLTMQLLMASLVVAAMGMLLASLIAEASLVRFATTRSRKRTTAAGEVGRLRRQVELASASRDDYERFLRGTLSEIAARLLRGHGVDLASEPVRAQRLLGVDAWELVRPDAARLVDAPSIDRLTALVERLERL